MKHVCGLMKCTWTGDLDEGLSAQNPFDLADTLYACPKCNTIGLHVACDVDECAQPMEYGEKTEEGYVRRCQWHAPAS